VKDLFAVAEQFARTGRIADVHEMGSGNINDTFLVTMDEGVERHWVLQRINTRVFRKPDLIMQNLRVATEHMRKRLEDRPPGDRHGWKVPRLIPTRSGRDYITKPAGSLWRGLSFIEGCKSFNAIVDGRHAEEVGRALGMFHVLLGDLPPERLADTLEGFHITPLYLRHYAEVISTRSAGRSAEEDFCSRFVEERAGWADVLEDAKRKGKLFLRPIHGDPKVDNIMIDDSTGHAVGVVDLDTVKPGLIHYDIGDCLRSACNSLGEETAEWEKVRFDTDICRAVLRGYLSEANRFLTSDDFSYLYDSVRLIAFELGLRFFTDHLEGNVYFKVKKQRHNLARALVQFRLTSSIEAQEGAIRAMIRDLQ
jgi:Ser/Thr protein kinase RdoA (MazF antagonist)